jgi:hypothetical protein
MSSNSRSAGEKSHPDAARGSFGHRRHRIPHHTSSPSSRRGFAGGNSRLDLFQSKSTGFSSCSLCSLCSQEKRKKRLEKLSRLSSHLHSHTPTLQKLGTRGTPHNPLILLHICSGTPKSAGNIPVRARGPRAAAPASDISPSFRKAGADGAGGSTPVAITAQGVFHIFLWIRPSVAENFN